jgi:hypothetical protein
MTSARRYGAIFCFAVAIIVFPLASNAEQQRKPPRIGYLSPGDVPYYDNAFLQGLQDRNNRLPLTWSLISEPLRFLVLQSLVKSYRERIK